MSQVNEPFMGTAKCRSCAYQWTAILPDGCVDSEHGECPKCGKMTGSLIDDTQKNTAEKKLGTTTETHIDLGAKPPQVPNVPQAEPRKKCGCFDCSGFCLCACDDRETQLCDDDRMVAFDRVFDLVAEDKAINKPDIVALQLSGEEVQKLGQFFAGCGYKADDHGVYPESMAPLRGKL